MVWTTEDILNGFGSVDMNTVLDAMKALETSAKILYDVNYPAKTSNVDSIDGVAIGGLNDGVDQL